MRNIVKTRLIGGVVAGGLMVGAAALIVGAGIAKADVAHPIYGREGDKNVMAFIPEMYPDGIYLTSMQAMQVANNVCGEEAMGMTRDQVINATEQHGYSSWYSIDAVMGAEWHFCPQFDSQHIPVQQAPTPPSQSAPPQDPSRVPQTLAGMPIT